MLGPRVSDAAALVIASLAHRRHIRQFFVGCVDLSRRRARTPTLVAKWTLHGGLVSCPFKVSPRPARINQLRLIERCARKSDI